MNVQLAVHAAADITDNTGFERCAAIAYFGHLPRSGLVYCVAVCCGVLRCVAVCCSLLQSVAVCSSLFQSVPVCSSLFQSAAVCVQQMVCLQQCVCNSMSPRVQSHIISLTIKESKLTLSLPLYLSP